MLFPRMILTLSVRSDGETSIGKEVLREGPTTWGGKLVRDSKEAAFQVCHWNDLDDAFLNLARAVRVSNRSSFWASSEPERFGKQHSTVVLTPTLSNPFLDLLGPTASHHVRTALLDTPLQPRKQHHVPLLLRDHRPGNRLCLDLPEVRRLRSHSKRREYTPVPDSLLPLRRLRLDLLRLSASERLLLHDVYASPPRR
jgi:hypothetical protein